MAWEDHISPGLIDELPYFVAAAIIYASLFALDPQIRWGSRERAPDRSVPIEFVATLPVPSPNLAPAPDAGNDMTPRLGPGDYVPEKVRAGAPQAPPKPHPVIKPARPKPQLRPRRAVVAKAVVHVKHAARRPAPNPAAVAAAREAAHEKAVRVAQAREAEHERAVHAAAVNEVKREAAAQKAAAAAEVRREEAAEKAAALAVARHQEAVRRAAAREARRQAAEEKALAEKAAAEKRAAVERERRQELAEARAAEAKRKADLAHQLATMSDPDEALDAGENSGSAAASTGRSVSRAPSAAQASGAPAPATAGDGTTDAGMIGARRASAAAALSAAADPADAGDAPGQGGADLLDAKATGGGSGPEGSGVSWTMDGPVGNRRVLRRAAPTSPAWVGARGLDLTVAVRFRVLPDGKIKRGAVIVKTSGFPEIDRRALDALKGWLFDSAPGASETWGRVTFRFTSS